MLSTLNQIIKSEHDTVGNGKHEIRKGYTQFFRILPTFFRVETSVSCHSDHSPAADRGLKILQDVDCETFGYLSMARG